MATTKKIEPVKMTPTQMKKKISFCCNIKCPLESVKFIQSKQLENAIFGYVAGSMTPKTKIIKQQLNHE